MSEKPPKPADPRWKPFLDFAYQAYREEFGVTLLIDATDTAQLKSMLTKTQNLSEFDLSHLQMAWLCFIRSAKPFDREQGKPLRYFCSNVNRFMAQLTNGNSNKNLDAAREFVKKKLETP